MAENQDGQEKSQEPTGKKITDSRKKGQLPRSRELNTMALTFLGAASLGLFGFLPSIHGMAAILAAIFAEVGVEVDGHATIVRVPGPTPRGSAGRGVCVDSV